MIHPLRLLHTSDWHLGHELHGHGREEEHDAFLTWLLGRLEEERVDALAVTGDVFDVANPPIAATRVFYTFLREAVARLPRLTIVVVGGNHDSAQRINLPGELIGRGRVHLVGCLPRCEQRLLDLDRLLIPLRLLSRHRLQSPNHLRRRIRLGLVGQRVQARWTRHNVRASPSSCLPSLGRTGTQRRPLAGRAEPGQPRAAAHWPNTRTSARSARQLFGLIARRAASITVVSTRATVPNGRSAVSVLRAGMRVHTGGVDLLATASIIEKTAIALSPRAVERC